MILDEIIAYTRLRVEEKKKHLSLENMKEKANEVRSREQIRKETTKEGSFPFEEVLKQPGMHVICEVKKASPSKGILDPEFNYLEIAKAYERAGAAAISVLTEPAYFQGKEEYLVNIHKEVSIPLLRKDFTIDEYQLYEAKVLGASCVLLICGILTKEQLEHYLQLCEELQLSALVETHSKEEICMALECGARIVGVNNRNLQDFSEDLQCSIAYRKQVPDHVIFVAESGIHTKEDMKVLYEERIRVVLIGEELMRATNKDIRLKELLSLCE